MTQEFSKLDGIQSLKAAFDDESGAFRFVDGFLLGEVGRKIAVTYPDTTSEVYTYLQGETTLYAITVTYTDATKAFISSAERTA
jgi:hypothetical protein